MRLDAYRDRMQQAALDPEQWPGLLHDLSRSAGAVGAILISSSHKLPFSPISKDLVPIMERYYREGWNREDIRFRGFDLALRNGAAVDQDILTEREIDRAPFYQDLLRSYECKWFCGISFRIADDYWFLSVQRTSRQGYFAPDEVTRLKTLARSLSEAGTLSRALSFSRILGMTDALDHMSQAAFILDERGHLLRCNDLAARSLAGILDFRHRLPRFSDPDSQSRFDRALADASSPRAVLSGRDVCASLALGKEGAARELRVTKLDGWASYTFTQARFLVTVHERTSSPLSVEQRLKAQYRLTPTETRLTLALCSGLSVRMAADSLGMSYETARTHLRSIYAKTGVNRQGALVTLVADIRR